MQTDTSLKDYTATYLVQGETETRICYVRAKNITEAGDKVRVSLGTLRKNYEVKKIELS